MEVPWLGSVLSRCVVEDGVNVYKNVAVAGREKRKAEFIELWDNLAENGTSEFQKCKSMVVEVGVCCQRWLWFAAASSSYHLI